MDKVALFIDDWKVLKKALEKHYNLSVTNIQKQHFIFQNILYVVKPYPKS